MEGDLKMDILKGKRYDIMNVLWEEGRPLSAFEINDIAPELKNADSKKMPGASFEREPDPGCGNFNERQGVCKKLYPSSFKRGLFKGKCQKQKD